MFSINGENRIIYCEMRVNGLYAEPADFDDIGELTVIAEARKWSKQTVTDIWNWLVDELGTMRPVTILKPQKCFKNRGYGLAKLWAAIQRLIPSGEAASEAPAQRRPTTRECPECEGTVAENYSCEEAPVKKTKRAAKAAKPKVEKAAKGKTKRDEVIRLISREKGASLDELVEKLGWERHTLRGLLSTLGSKHGLKIESTKSETKGRVYRLVA